MSELSEVIETEFLVDMSLEKFKVAIEKLKLLSVTYAKLAELKGYGQVITVVEKDDEWTYTYRDAEYAQDDVTYVFKHDKQNSVITGAFRGQADSFLFTEVYQCIKIKKSKSVN